MSRKVDLTGKRFGKLLVLSESAMRDGSSVVWRCICDCGRSVYVPARNLLHRGTVSCGCNRREKSIRNLSGSIAEKLGQVEHTNASRLASEKIQANNKSGFTGVSWHRNRHGGGRWIAVIYFKGTRYRLGFFDTPEEASSAYQAAKAKLHKDFLEWYNSTYKRKTIKPQNP